MQASSAVAASLKDVLPSDEFEPLMAVDEDGILYMSIGLVDAEGERAQHGRPPGVLLPVLRHGLQTEAEIDAKTRRPA